MKTCPQCHLLLEPIQWESLTIHACRSCGGCWFDAPGFRQALEANRARLAQLNALFPGVASAGAFEGLPKPCPDCRTVLLEPVEMPQSAGLRVPACARCQGVWLDPGARAALSCAAPAEAPAEEPSVLPAPSEAPAVSDLPPITPPPVVSEPPLPSALPEPATAPPPPEPLPVEVPPVGPTDAPDVPAPAAPPAPAAFPEPPPPPAEIAFPTYAPPPPAPPAEAAAPPQEEKPGVPDRTEILSPAPPAFELPPLTPPAPTAPPDRLPPVNDPEQAAILSELIAAGGSRLCPRCLRIYRSALSDCPECAAPLVEPDYRVHCPACRKGNSFINDRCRNCGVHLRTPPMLDKLYPARSMLSQRDSLHQPHLLTEPNDASPAQPPPAPPSHLEAERWCPQCRRGYPATMSFCTLCGVGLALSSFRIRCQQCNSENTISAQRCWQCQANLHPADSPGAPIDRWTVGPPPVRSGQAQGCQTQVFLGMTVFVVFVITLAMLLSGR